MGQTVVANLVFHEAGFGADRIAQGELSHAEADSLVKAVEALAAARVLVVEHGSPPESGQMVDAGFVVLGNTSAGP